MRVIVTGGAGYIGGETVLKLLDAGHSVFAIDRVAPGENLKDCGAKWLTDDVVGEIALDTIKNFKPDAVIHCAGTSLVGPSLINPEDYYYNNFIKTKTLVDYIVDNQLGARFIFSSSAATYGSPIMTPCQEVDPCEPISPYGESKLMIEWLLKSYHRAYGLDYVAFRYFNACGADSQGRHGQAPKATHIIARALEAIKDNTGGFVLNGKDFDTEDGTCVRDYIHVEDLADAHILAMDTAIPSDVYNLGTNQGYSNLQILHGAIKVTGKDLEYSIGPQREGDPAILTADAAKFMSASSWQPKFDLKNMIEHAWVWYNR
jgi:UDP-glucose 4-epimerase